MSATAHTVSPRSESFMHLVGDLQTDIKNLIKKEIELAKTEMSEKAKVVGRNAAFGAAGGLIALMALFMLFLGIGAIIARLLVMAGLSPGVAYFVSYMGFALILGIVGYILIQKAIHAFSHVSLAPEKALETVRSHDTVEIQFKKSEKKEHKEAQPDSDQLKSQVMTARERMESEMSELKARLNPGYMAKSMVAGLKHHPVTAVLCGVGTSLGGYLYWRKRHQIAVVKHGFSLGKNKFKLFRMRHA